VTPDQILARITPLAVAPEGGSETRNYHFQADNGRLFNIRRFEDGDYMLEEFTPNGRCCAPDPRDESRDIFWSDRRVKVATASPNDFFSTIESQGVNPEHVILAGGGIGVATRYFRSLEDCAKTIHDALERNEWYSSVDHEKLADPEFLREQREADEAGRRAYRAEQAEAYSKSQAEPGLFKGLYSMMGPLSDETKRSVLDYLNAPAEEKWDRLHGRIIQGHITLWQAWIKVDPSAPKSKELDAPWPRIPSAEVLTQALRAIGDTKPTPRREADSPEP
jgi:hypothetical protein